jgi:hypothetical protein
MDQLNKTQFIKNRRQGFNSNLDFDSNSQSNSNSSLFSNLSLEGDYTTWLLWILLFIIVVIICYLTVMTAKYVSTECANKRSWFNYIIRFCYNDVCLVSKLPAAPVINNVHTTNLPPMPPIMQQKTTPIPELRKGGPSTPLFGRREVFHIANQDYTFEQARCKCESYNAKLATYDQLVDAYNEGAEWCSYGWSNGQRAYYPTQKCNWQKKSPEERLKCGNPGLNGGFFADPYLKFGVNCYGRKPRGKISKLKDPVCNNGVKYCELPQNFGASNRLETDEIAPFNGNKWNN